jgi:hypothetical protein
MMHRAMAGAYGESFRNRAGDVFLCQHDSGFKFFPPCEISRDGGRERAAGAVNILGPNAPRLELTEAPAIVK